MLLALVRLTAVYWLCRGPRVLLVGVCVGVIATLVLGIAFGSRAWDSFTTPAQNTTTDPAARLTNLNGNRYLIWGSALAAFRAHPVEGTGAGTFELWWNRDARGDEFVRDGHSLYLEAAAELG